MGQPTIRPSSFVSGPIHPLGHHGSGLVSFLSGLFNYVTETGRRPGRVMPVLIYDFEYEGGT